MLKSKPDGTRQHKRGSSQLGPGEYIAQLVETIVEHRRNRTLNSHISPKSSKKPRSKRKIFAKPPKLRKSRRRARGAPEEASKPPSTAHEVPSPSILLKGLKAKGRIDVEGVTLWPTDLFDAIGGMENTAEKTQAVCYVMSLFAGAMIKNEFTARHIATMIESLPEPDQAKLQEELKQLIIDTIGKEHGRTDLFLFVNQILPEFNLSSSGQKEIIKRLNLSKIVSEETIIGSEEEALNHLRCLKTYHLHFAIPVLKNLVVYTRLRLQGRDGSPSQAEMAFNRIVKTSLKEAIGEIAGNYKLYPFIRQILKDTFLLSSSLIERIDRLCRIAEREVNVSTHKGQDLLSPGDLKKILEIDHQRRPSGPNGTFDPKVTEALEALLTITEQLSGKEQGIVYDSQFFTSDPLLKRKVDQANAEFTKGKPLKALFDLTRLREEIRTQIHSKMQKAYTLKHSSTRRYGKHMRQAETASERAVRLTEMDIVLERMVNDHSADVFKYIFTGLPGTRGKNIAAQFVSMLMAVYIIAQNALLSGFGRRNLGFFAQQLSPILRQDSYGPRDYARAYGMVHQIRSLIVEIIQILEEDYRWRAEAATDRKRGKITKSRPEALGFVQDLLRTTSIRQFGERYIVRVEDALKNLAEQSSFIEGVTIDPVLRKDVAAVANLPPRQRKSMTVPLKECRRYGEQVMGTKAQGLSTLIHMGLPVPDGFVIVSEKRKASIAPRFKSEIRRELEALEKRTGKKLGDPKDPLILSLRASFPVSMPGTFPTVTNAGMNQGVVKALEAKYSNPKFAVDCYLRFVRSFYETMVDTSYPLDYVVIPKDATIEELRHLLGYYEEELARTKISIPDDPWEQISKIAARIMYHSIKKSVQLACAIHGMPSDWLLSVIVQEMVFGNLDNSYTAVVHTRDTRDGRPNLAAEVLFERQGEDLVSRKRTLEALKMLPEKDEVFIKKIRPALEKRFGPTEVELTNEQGRTFFLQARSARLNPKATERALRDIVSEGILTSHQARKRMGVKSEELPTVDPREKALLKGTGVSGGAVTGEVALSIERALKRTKKGKNAVLILEYTPGREIQDRYPRQIGVLTIHGGSAQHYAAWCRSIRRPYVTMVDGMEIDLDKRVVKMGPEVVAEGEKVTIDGATGNIYQGSPKLVVPDKVTRAARRASLLRRRTDTVDADDDVDPFIGISL